MKTSIKEELHLLIDTCNDRSLLEEAKSLLQDLEPQKDWWDDLTEEDQSLVKESEAEYKRGNFITFSELMQQLDSKNR
jgi:hypothetical protein